MDERPLQLPYEAKHITPISRSQTLRKDLFMLFAINIFNEKIVWLKKDV